MTAKEVWEKMRERCEERVQEVCLLPFDRGKQSITCAFESCPLLKAVGEEERERDA